jgi:cold-inducible RNA-binding protein
MSQKLFVGGLPFSTSTEELGQLFGQVSGVENVTIVTDRDTGRSRGFAFVEMATAEAADEAMRKFNGSTLGGRTLTVDMAKPSAPRGGGDGRSGGGYRSGGGSRW